jgi:hypothetical protein
MDVSHLRPVLDLGASHYMLNNLSFFTDSTDCDVPITTGKGAADLHATKKGMASITLPENLARMAASEFILDAGIRFKLGRAPPSELLTDSNSVARAFGHRV